MQCFCDSRVCPRRCDDALLNHAPPIVQQLAFQLRFSCSPKDRLAWDILSATRLQLFLHS